MKKFDLQRIFFLLSSILILFLGIFIKNINAKASFISAIIIFSLAIFDMNAAKIAKLSEENPKVKTMTKLNRLTIFIVILLSLFTIISPLKNTFSDKYNELLLIGLVSLFMMIFGNASPKIPFNRYLGLRLPWTIRDEDTWKLAHRIVGYLSFPIAIIQFLLTFFIDSEKAAVIGILTWVFIPSIISLIFYYKKMKGLKFHH